MVIAGSTAIKHWIPSFREPFDTDIIISVDDDITTRNDIIRLPQNIIDILPVENDYLTLDGVFTLKCSHMGWDIKWNKHKKDVLFLKQYGCQIIPSLYKQLVNFWKTEHKNKPYLSLYKTKQEFFDDYVPHFYDHDYLHELVAYPNIPIYTKCLKDNEEVAICIHKFNNLCIEEQLKMFKEEICVIALERWIVNEQIKNPVSLFKAYKLALHKTITSLTKNWACDFIIQNIDYYELFDKNMFVYALSRLPQKDIITNSVNILNIMLKNGLEIDNKVFLFDNIKKHIHERLDDNTIVLKFKHNTFYMLEYDSLDKIYVNENNTLCYEVHPVKKLVTTFF
ncbi:MAG: hypothetical protein KDH96_06495 [Candidatus Riesia sp.]|nr:hypothetical protein [Candidatus Riesia sp.]